MNREGEEQKCNLAIIALALDSRVLDALSEIARCLEIGGCSKVDWHSFRDRVYGVGNKDKSNLRQILLILEDCGLITREPGLSTWGMLWVNPVAIRHKNAKESYFTASVKGWCSKREKAREARGLGGTPDLADRFMYAMDGQAAANEENK